MFRLLPRRFQHRLRPVGLLIAAVAMAGQLAFGAMADPLPPSGRYAALAALSILCHGHQQAPDRPAPSRRIPFVAVCPFGVALPMPVAVLPPFMTLPAPPSALALRIAQTPRPGAPHAQAVLTAYPRGPPVSI